MNQTIAPKRNLPRDVFLHLFSIVALYWSAVSFITLCWQYVNYFFPDILTMRYNPQAYVWPIRFAVSSLVIMFPLFILVSWYLNKIYRREAAVRDSRIRKWLIYLTLFVAALIIAGDLVTVIYNFLGGDVTIRFILKALSVLVVAAVVFIYYLDDVRRAESAPSARYFAWGTSAVILIAIIGAFFIVGSPQSARLQQFDQQRVNDLQNIQYQVVNYWQRKGQMPNTLADLNDSISGYIAPTDPQNGQSYQYILKDPKELAFQLCVNFSTNNNDQSVTGLKAMPAYPPASFQSWNHPTGIFCFERTIDQQLYPPLNKGR